MTSAYTFHPTSGRIVNDRFPFRLHHRRLHRAERQRLMHTHGSVSQSDLLRASAAAWLLLALVIAVWIRATGERSGTPSFQTPQFYVAPEPVELQISAAPVPTNEAARPTIAAGRAGWC